MSKHELPYSFADCVELLAKRNTKKLKNNTYLEKIDEKTFGIKFHDTYVVKIFDSGLYELNTGGYKTKTTKVRMSEFSPIAVCQKRGEWFIFNYKKNTTIPFYNGVMVDKNGEKI